MEHRIAFESFDQWHQAICRDYSLAEFIGDLPSHLAARLSVSQFGGFAYGDSRLHTNIDLSAKRSAADVRRDPRDPFSVMLVRAGEVTVQQDGRIVRGVAGDLFMYDHGRPFEVTLHGSHQVATLGLPRALLETRMSNPSRLTARAITNATPAGALAVAMVDQFGALGTDLGAGAMDRLGDSLLDVLAASFDAVTPHGLPSPRCKLLLDAQSYMRTRLADPNLHINAITNALGVSARTLNRVFAAEGTTPMRWLWRQRLAESYNLLAAGKIANITDAALSCGFSDLAHFSRAFKIAFGRTASSFKDRS